MKNIAIIGAGIAGLTAAYKLQKLANVTIFEKSRGVSGRMSTRYADEYEFDHGAQYFTIKTDAFRSFLHPYINNKTIRQWPAQMAVFDNNTLQSTKAVSDIYVSAPRMNSLCKAIANDIANNITLHLNTRIVNMLPISSNKKQWVLIDDHENPYKAFDHVIFTSPAPQALDVISPHDVSFTDSLHKTKMTGCFTVMLGLDKTKAISLTEDKWDIAKISNHPIETISLNHRKPGRNPAPSIVIQSSNDWAEHHLENQTDTVEKNLLELARDFIDFDANQIEYKSLHRWRYAATKAPSAQIYLHDSQLNISACGDWCEDGRVESAFHSAFALTKHLIEKLG